MRTVFYGLWNFLSGTSVFLALGLALYALYILWHAIQAWVALG